jgi:MerR family copper efflux transcriptional regulator
VRIGEIVQKTGIGVHTIRFYERIGLIAEDSVRRLPNNYRDYSKQVIETLRFIKYGQMIGFSLRELAELVQKQSLTETTPKRQLELLEMKLAAIEEKIRDAKALRNIIARKIEQIQKRTGRQPNRLGKNLRRST